MEKRDLNKLIRGHLPFQDTEANAGAYIDAMVAALQEALLVSGRVSLRGLGTIEIKDTPLGRRTAFRPAPAIRQIQEEHEPWK